MTSNLFDAPDGALRTRVGRGAAVTGLAQGVRMGTQILSVIVLSRLLSPEDFGVAAMCAPVLAFLSMFQDLGLSQATIQRRSITHEEVNYLFWINVACGAALACFLYAVAPLVAAFYDDGRVGSLVAASSLQIVVSSLGVQHSALLNRRMEFGRLAVVDIAYAVASLGACIAWALVDSSFWALYAGALTGALVSTTLLWTFSGWRPGFWANAAGAHGLLRFGAGITGFNLANFFARNADNVLIGKYWGGGELGLYDRAYKLLLFPLSQITNPLAKVMIPTLSRMQDEPGRYRHAFLRVMRWVLLATLPGVAFAVASADTLIPVLMGEKWRQSSVIFQALGFAALVQPLNNPSGWLFISQGRTGDYMRWGILTAVTSVLAFLIGLPYGALGVAVCYAASEYLRTPFLWLYVGRKGPLRTGDVLGSLAPFVLGAHLALAALWLCRPLTAEAGLLGYASALVLSYVITLAIALIFPSSRHVVRDGLEILKSRALPLAEAKRM
ncbi:lipopolysaccharide biosynthesis protein [Azospirillum sp. SYSU D00513]|uniref:lipopolysaccharide biosynthesis protein n=1 Tax=Azospirillum sp. SYSU D00513 TaxID=2812561 RepID=UPI001A95A281|nr:lipopolysaccharide biosynthesis protein [Azospirillum sp. SYSU D00513]